MGNMVNIGGVGFGFSFSLFFIIAVLWSLVWKGLALWHAARRKEKPWFIALLLINTLGILEIVYLFAVAKMNADQVFGTSSGAGKHTPPPPQM